MSVGHLYLMGSCPILNMQKSRYPFGYLPFGAGDRTRTGTLSPAVDFESTTSTIPSHRHGTHIV